MPIKRLFKQNENHEILLNKIAELEKKQLRVNAFEVQMKKLLHLEEKMMSIIMQNDGAVRDKKSSTSVKKVANHIHKMDVMAKQIERLEKDISQLKQSKWARKETLFSDASTLKSLAPIFNIIDLMDKQIVEMESNISMLHQGQTDIHVRLDSIEATLANISCNEQPEDKGRDQSVVIKEIHIDKFYLDKYEQSNNFGQLGIKELSGALNIGATYGSGVIPKEFTDQIKEDIQEMKGMKKEFENKEGGESDDAAADVNESDVESTSSPEDETFIEIPIDFVEDESSS